MKTAVIYARYSSERQTEQSIEGQLRVCQEYAEKNDMVIVDTYIDRAMTGTNDNRADFQRMIKDSYKKAWNVVLVYKLDRFSRDKYETAIHRRTLKNNGAKLISAMENIPDTPEGIILESLLEGMNQYYSAELSQKVRRGMKESRSKGNFTGGYIIYGYKVENKKVIIDEDQAKIIRYVFTEFAGGRLVTDIMAELNEKGVLNHGKPFARTTVYRLLSTEKYSGIYHYGNETFTDIYPQIVPNEVYEIVKLKLETNKYGKHKENVYYLLKNKLKCGYCGKPVNSDAGTSKTGAVMRYYKCSGKRKDKSCPQSPIRKEVLEKLVTDTITQTMSPDMIDYIADRIMDVHKKKVNDQSVLNILMKEHEDVERSINNILNAIENGISTNSTKQRLEDLEEKKSDLTNKIALEKNKEQFEITKNDIIKYVKKAIQKDPRQMVRLLIKEIILYNERIEIYMNYTDRKEPDDGNDHRVFSFYSTTRSAAIDQRKTGINAVKVNYTIELYI